MHKFVLVVTLVAGLVMIATPAQADVTFWLGQVESDDFFIEGTQVWGGAVGFSFFKYFGVELAVDYASDSELPFNLEELEDLFGVDLTVDMLFITGNVVVQYPFGGITPYATAGYGAFGLRISSVIFDDIEDELSGSTVFDWGFGAKVDVAPWFAIRGEWRQYRLDFAGAEDDNILSQLEDPTFERFAIGAALTF